MEKIQKSKNPDFSRNLPWVFARLVPFEKKSKIHQRHLLTLNENKKKKNLLSEIHSDSYMKDFGAMALS